MSEPSTIPSNGMAFRVIEDEKGWMAVYETHHDALGDAVWCDAEPVGMVWDSSEGIEGGHEALKLFQVALSLPVLQARHVQALKRKKAITQLCLDASLRLNLKKKDDDTE